MLFLFINWDYDKFFDSGFLALDILACISNKSFCLTFQILFIGFRTYARIKCLLDYFGIEGTRLMMAQQYKKIQRPSLDKPLL
jgi:hypothetical protein